MTSGRKTAYRSTKKETSKQMLNAECSGLKKHISEETRKRATALVHTQKKRQKPGYTGKQWSESSTAWPQSLTQNRPQVSNGQCTAMHLRGFCQPVKSSTWPASTHLYHQSEWSHREEGHHNCRWVMKQGTSPSKSAEVFIRTMTLGKGSCSSSYRKKIKKP